MNDIQKIEYEQLCSAITLSRKPGIGATRFAQFLQQWETPQKALKNTPEIFNPLQKYPKKNFDPPSLKTLQTQNLSFCYYRGPDYPKPFYSLSEPPPYLFFRGTPVWNSHPIITIVGTRTPSREGIHLARKMTQWAIQEGYCIASGGAFGIDAVIHQTCLEFSAPTLVLLASGLNQTYPPEHQNLFEEVSRAHGCLLSEFLPDTPPRKSFFPTRNRLLAGIAEKILWIEGRSKSGARYTAQTALKLGKTVVVGYGNDPDLQEGPKSFLPKGALEISDFLQQETEKKLFIC